MKTERYFHPCDRYYYDFKRCRPHEGWAQLDSRQDASYYGNWVNPLTLELMSYCEGDVTHITCDTPAEFANQVRSVIVGTTTPGHRSMIDGMLNDKIIAALHRMDLPVH